MGKIQTSHVNPDGTRKTMYLPQSTQKQISHVTLKDLRSFKCCKLGYFKNMCQDTMSYFCGKCDQMKYMCLALNFQLNLNNADPRNFHKVYHLSSCLNDEKKSTYFEELDLFLKSLQNDSKLMKTTITHFKTSSSCQNLLSNIPLQDMEIMKLEDNKETTGKKIDVNCTALFTVLNDGNNNN